MKEIIFLLASFCPSLKWSDHLMSLVGHCHRILELSLTIQSILISINKWLFFVSISSNSWTIIQKGNMNFEEEKFVNNIPSIQTVTMSLRQFRGPQKKFKTLSKKIERLWSFQKNWENMAQQYSYYKDAIQIKYRQNRH